MCVCEYIHIYDLGMEKIKSIRNKSINSTYSCVTDEWMINFVFLFFWNFLIFFCSEKVLPSWPAHKFMDTVCLKARTVQPVGK